MSNTITYRDPRFPATIPVDARTSSIDLDTEEFYTGGARLTDARAEEYADAAEAGASVLGRPSLTAPGQHSPSLNLRVPEGTKRRLEAVATAQGRRQSDIVREALDDYLAAAA